MYLCLLPGHLPCGWNANMMAGIGAAILGHKMEAHVEDGRAIVKGSWILIVVQLLC